MSPGGPAHQRWPHTPGGRHPAREGGERHRPPPLSLRRRAQLHRPGPRLGGGRDPRPREEHPRLFIMLLHIIVCCSLYVILHCIIS